MFHNFWTTLLRWTSFILARNCLFSVNNCWGNFEIIFSVTATETYWTRSFLSVTWYPVVIFTHWYTRSIITRLLDGQVCKSSQRLMSRSITWMASVSIPWMFLTKYTPLLSLNLNLILSIFSFYPFHNLCHILFADVLWITCTASSVKSSTL